MEKIFEKRRRMDNTRKNMGEGGEGDLEGR